MPLNATYCILRYPAASRPRRQNIVKKAKQTIEDRIVLVGGHKSQNKLQN